MNENYSKEKVYSEVVEIMHELFELEPDQIKPESNLVEDLDLDSIDAVEMIVQLQKRTGKRIQPEQFQSVKTVNDVVEILQKLLSESQS